MPDDRTHVPNLSGEPTGTYQGVGPRDPLIGRVLKNAYQIEGKIGEGGMGIVYRATQIALGRHVAVKTINFDVRLPPTAVDRFLREAKLLSQLQHPNIVNIIDFGAEPGPLYFMVMEYLQGESLESFVQMRGRLAPELVLGLMEQICAGVSVAHQANVIHRDLKPANIIVIQVTGSPRPVVKILDFGLGKVVREGSQPTSPGLTREGGMMGTLCYSAPEQLEGGTGDARSDIYSLGAILYYLLTGRPAYRDEGFRATLVKQLSQPPDPLESAELGLAETPVLEEIIHKAMNPHPEGRHASASDLFAELERTLHPRDTLADRPFSRTGPIRPPHPRVAPTTPRPSRRKLLFGAAGAAAVLGAGGLAWWRFGRATPQRGPGATAPGVTATEIRLGMSGPFSGPTRELGMAIRLGIESCFDHVNNQQGVHGRRLKLVPMDDGYEPVRTAENMRTFLEGDNEVFAFLGNVGTPTTEVALPIALKAERVFFGAYTGAKLLRKDPPERWVFNYRASYSEETASIVHYLLEAKKLKPDQIAVFAQKDGYGDAGFEGVAKALRKHGRDREDILRVGYERNSIAVDEAAETILKVKDQVRAVVMVATYKPAASFIKKVKDGSAKTIFTNVSFVGSEALAEELRSQGTQYPQGVIVTQVVPHFLSNASGVLRYREHLKRYDSAAQPGFVSLEGYVAARILVEGLKNAGPTLTSDTLVEGLEQIHDLDLAIGTKIRFDRSEHQGSHKVWGTILDARGVYQDLDLE